MLQQKLECWTWQWINIVEQMLHGFTANLLIFGSSSKFCSFLSRVAQKGEFRLAGFEDQKKGRVYKKRC